MGDEDGWVSTVAHCTQQYLTHSHIPIDALLNMPTFEQVAKDTKSVLAAVDPNPHLLPMECELLSKSSLAKEMSSISQPTLNQKHFTLRRPFSKPHTQRTELMQKCKDLQQQQADSLNNSRSNRSAAMMNLTTAPVRNKTAPSRLKFGMNKSNLTASNHLHGKPHSAMSSASALDSPLGVSPTGGIPSRSNKDSVGGGGVSVNAAGKRGAKLIEITDQPLGGPGRLKRHKSVTVVNPNADSEGGGKGDANGEYNKTIDESVSSSAKKENADNNMSLSEEEESIGGESGKTPLSAGASGEVGRGGRRGSRGHDIVIEENPDAASQAGASMTAGHMYVTKLENKSDYEAGVGISATVSFEPRSDERWGGGGGNGAGMQQPQNFQPGTNSGSSAAIPDYMMGLQTTYANQVGSEPLDSGFKSYNQPFQSMFPVIGSNPNTPTQLTSQNQMHGQYSPFEHDYPHKRSSSGVGMGVGGNIQYGTPTHSLSSQSPMSSRGGTPGGPGGVTRSPAGTTPGNESGSPAAVFNFFQPASDAIGSLKPANSSLIDERNSSPVRSIANQLKQIADQNSSTNLSPLAMSNIKMSPSGGNNQMMFNPIANSSVPTGSRSKVQSSTRQASQKTNDAATASTSKTPATGLSTLDKLLSSATKLTDADRQKIQRFLGGEASAEENSWGPGGGGDKGSKVSVVLSEMRVPAEIKGELCTSVVSTVFEMDYTNRKWKVVKHTNVIKGTSHSSPSSANRAK
ncbi:uncharacterized protein LOC134842631 isoform X2 [Symsagittifera roscoffensis]